MRYRFHFSCVQMLDAFKSRKTKKNLQLVCPHGRSERATSYNLSFLSFCKKLNETQIQWKGTWKTAPMSSETWPRPTRFCPAVFRTERRHRSVFHISHRANQNDEATFWNAVNNRQVIVWLVAGGSPTSCDALPSSLMAEHSKQSVSHYCPLGWGEDVTH